MRSRTRRPPAPSSTGWCRRASPTRPGTHPGRPSGWRRGARAGDTSSGSPTPEVTGPRRSRPEVASASPACASALKRAPAPCGPAPTAAAGSCSRPGGPRSTEPTRLRGECPHRRAPATVGPDGEGGAVPGGVISVVVVDDQELIRSGVRAMIEAAPDLRVVGEAADGEEGARVVAVTDPDVVVMDVQMPGADGIAGLTALVESRVRARVLMLTMFDLDHYVLEALRIGASGFLLKTTPPDRLVAAIRDVHRGDRVFAPSVVD